MAYFNFGDQSANFQGSTLILKPALSIGNVGQISIDILVSTFQIPTVGYLESEHVAPVVGNDPYTPVHTGKLALSLEVFHSDNLHGKKVTLLQQRGATLKGHNRDFVEELITWFKKAQFKEIIVLLSSTAAYRFDSQMYGSQFRYITTLVDEKPFQTAEIAELESSSFDSTLKKGTVTRLLYDNYKDMNLPFTAISLFCYEGFNIPESIQMATKLVNYLGIPQDDWKLPPSLEVSLESKPLDQTLFG